MLTTFDDEMEMMISIYHSLREEHLSRFLVASVEIFHYDFWFWNFIPLNVLFYWKKRRKIWDSSSIQPRVENSCAVLLVMKNLDNLIQCLPPMLHWGSLRCISISCSNQYRPKIGYNHRRPPDVRIKKDQKKTAKNRNSRYGASNQWQRRTAVGSYFLNEGEEGVGE